MDDKANEKKQRIPRVFYGNQRYFKTYNQNDAKILKVLKYVENRLFEKDTFLEAIELKDFDPYQDVLKTKTLTYVILTYQHFIILKGNFKAVSMFCGIKDISKLECVDEYSLKIEYFIDGNA